MFNGKFKAVTFSYDDGVTQDQRLISMLNKYGLKGTFNLNSGLLGSPSPLRCAFFCILKPSKQKALPYLLGLMH